MTRCELATSLLTGHAAGELEPMEEAIVVEHLAECASCRAELARERRLRELVAGLPADECPDDLTAAIVAAVDAEPTPLRLRRSRAHTWSSTLTAAAMVAAAVLLVVVLPRSQPRVETPVLPLADTASVANPEPNSWTQDELDKAREEAQWALAFTAKVIDRAEKQTIVDVMRRLQKEAYSGFRERETTTSPGGRG